MVVAGNTGDAEQAVSVAGAFSMVQRLLVGKKGGGLGEEDGEGSESGVLDGIRDVLATSSVGQEVEHTVKGVGQCLKVQRISHTVSMTATFIATLAWFPATVNEKP